MLTLDRFLQPVPTCQLPIAFDLALTLLQSTQFDALVVVNEENLPLGMVSSRQLLLALVEREGELLPPRTQNASHFAQMSLDEPRAIAPLPLLKAQMPLTDFLADLQGGRIAHSQAWVYGLIDAQGKFLGLLDSRCLLPMLSVPDGGAVLADSLDLSVANEILCALLEQLPMPIVLQTESGTILQQNCTWREQIGQFTPPDEASACPLSPQQMQPLRLEALPFSAQALGFLPENQGSDEVKSLPSRPFLHTNTQSVPSVSELPHRERVWQFIRCRLNTSHFLAPIWLVLATEVTQEQQLCQELVAKNADLVQLNRLKDEFLACISHELKSPLTAVVGLSSLLREQKVGSLNAQQVHYADLIYQSGRQLMTLVNDLLDLTRLETGQLKINLVKVPIKAICERAYRIIEEKYSGKLTRSLPFSLEIEARIDQLIADELRLQQMLVHLLDNAMKFTQAGGSVGLKVNRWENWIAFTVWDTGIGIPEESQHLIFQKFQQLESPLTREFEGTGLGLVLTQRLARAHGGEVSFISKSGQGSQFTLLLPMRPSAEIYVSDSCQTQASDLLVLVVEAIPHYIEDLMDKLIPLGYRVVVARTGTEAIEKARQLSPQAIFLNPLLPLLSGQDVLTLLKSDPHTQNIRTIVTATQGSRASVESQRADGYLDIPVDGQALQSILAEWTAPVTCPARAAKPSPKESLTILRLYPNRTQSQEVTSQLDWPFISHLRECDRRILEADDLDQAQLLAHVWQVDVIVLDGSYLDAPADFLRSLSQIEGMSSIPLVTLDRKTTEAANRIGELTVFPCLIPENHENMPQLWQVIQVAAGIAQIS